MIREGSRLGHNNLEDAKCENKTVSHVSSKTASPLAPIFSDRLALRTLHFNPPF